MVHKRMRPAMRKKQIVEHAIRLAEQGDYKEVSAKAIGEAVGIAASSVLHHFKTMTQLRRDIMREAVQTGNIEVLAQGVRDGSPYVLKANYDALAEATKRAESWT